MTPRRTGQLCQHCLLWFRPKQRPTTAKYCGKPCATKARTRQSRVEAGRKGGRAKSDIQWDSIALLSPVDAFKLGRLVRKAWMTNRLVSARREGLAEGYEQALRDAK